MSGSVQCFDRSVLLLIVVTGKTGHELKNGNYTNNSTHTKTLRFLTQHSPLGTIYFFALNKAPIQLTT
jgi:hypothetical protein